MHNTSQAIVRNCSRIRPRFIAGFSLMLAFFLTSPAMAGGSEDDVVSISGFGTLGAVRHGSDGVDYRRDISQPNGAKPHRWNVDVDSMLGVQATARPASNLEATVQLVSRYAIGVGYNPQVTWAYMKWKPREDLTLRAGRLGIELYMQGDSAEIGYANLLMRQPMIFYPRLFDGADAEWITPLGAGTLRLKGQVGKAFGKLAPGSGAPYDAQGARGRIFLAEYAQGGWTGRVSTGRLTLASDPVDANTQALYRGLATAPKGADILAAIGLRDRAMDYVTAALAYDAGPIQAMVGHSIISTPHVPDLKALYLQAGYRIGKFTPYAAYTRQWNQRNLIQTGIPWGFSAASDALNQGALVAQTSMWSNQSVVAAGLRHHLTRNTALKFQIDHIRYQDPTAIVDPSLLTANVAARGFKRMTLFSAALEFVF